MNDDQHSLITSLGVQEPTEQPYGVRDCAFRDPAGNLIRINQLR
jgi:catechol 2,3-dioxygenase-like lactoylglutathione lyase family enzyme